jgi:hypothetical protein
MVYAYTGVETRETVAKQLKKAGKKPVPLKPARHRIPTRKAGEKVSAGKPGEDVVAEEEIGRALRSFSAGTENIW